MAAAAAAVAAATKHSVVLCLSPMTEKERMGSGARLLVCAYSCAHKDELMIAYWCPTTGGPKWPYSW